MLKQLGYNRFLKSARNGDQEALIRFLYAFREGMTGEMQTAITEKGVAPNLIHQIIAYADQIKEANVSQETLKATSKEISQEAVDYFNKTFQEAMDICKIGAAYYYDDPVKRSQFTFSKILRNLNASRSMATDQEEQEPTT